MTWGPFWTQAPVWGDDVYLHQSHHNIFHQRQLTPDRLPEPVNRLIGSRLVMLISHVQAATFGVFADRWAGCIRNVNGMICVFFFVGHSVYGLVWHSFYSSVSSPSLLRSPKSSHNAKGTFLLFEHGAFHHFLSRQTFWQVQPAGDIWA